MKLVKFSNADEPGFVYINPDQVTKVYPPFASVNGAWAGSRRQHCYIITAEGGTGVLEDIDTVVQALVTGESPRLRKVGSTMAVLLTLALALTGRAHAQTFVDAIEMPPSRCASSDLQILLQIEHALVQRGWAVTAASLENQARDQEAERDKKILGELIPSAVINPSPSPAVSCTGEACREIALPEVKQ